MTVVSEVAHFWASSVIVLAATARWVKGHFVKKREKTHHRNPGLGLFVVHTNHGSGPGSSMGSPADGTARSDEGQCR